MQQKSSFLISLGEMKCCLSLGSWFSDWGHLNFQANLQFATVWRWAWFYCFIM